MIPDNFIKSFYFIICIVLSVNSWAETSFNISFSLTGEVVCPSVNNSGIHLIRLTDFTIGEVPSRLVSNMGISPDTPKIKGEKLVGSGSVGNALQGVSVSISADGKTAIVGGPGDDDGKGAVWVYQNVNGEWRQVGSKLVGLGAIGNAVHGISVSLSADGNTAIVGGPGDDDGKGAVWIYRNVKGVWDQEVNKLVGSDALSAAQGISVALSGDGKTAIVGGPEDNNNKGAVWIFSCVKGKWRQVGSKLVGFGAVGDAKQGYSVSLSGHGKTAIIGGYNDDGGKGAIWIFRYVAGVWRQDGSKLVASDAIGNAKQGSSVSLSADGNTAIAGAFGDDGDKGAVWIYRNLNGVWKQEGRKLVQFDAKGSAKQGCSVSLSLDGKTAIIGGSKDDGDKGAVWMYRNLNGVWHQDGNKLVVSGAADSVANQGYSIDLSADGKTAIVGGPGDARSKGTVWIFRY